MWTLAKHGILNAGVLCDWPAHDIAHELGGFYDLAHGATLSIILPAWMRYIWHIRPARFIQFSRVVMGVNCVGMSKEQAIMEGIRRLESFLSDIGMPIRLSDARIDDERLEEMARSAMRNRPYLGEFARLSCEDVLHIFQMALH